MRAREFITQAFDPTPQLKSKTLYHGTPSKQGFQGILHNGLGYDHARVQARYAENPNFAPMQGGSYLTIDFGNAVRYSLMLEVDDQDWQEYSQLEPNGYVFEFSGKDLSQITPDEDELGGFVVKLIKSKNLPPNLSKIANAVPKDIYDNLIADSGNYEYIALAGKWIASKLSDATLSYLIKNYGNVVNYGRLKPKAVWVIPRPKDPKNRFFNTYSDYANYAKQYGKRHDLTNADIDEGLGKYAAGALAAGALGYGLIATDPPADTNVGTQPQDPYSSIIQYQTPSSYNKKQEPQAPQVSPDKDNKAQPLLNNPYTQKLIKTAQGAGIAGQELAAFLAQAAHETWNFSRMIEKSVGDPKFLKYEIKHNPKTAKKLGNVHVGDGEKYRGRGFVQLTGRYNYKTAGQALGLPLEKEPELAADPNIAARIAVWFWKTRVQPNVSDYGDIEQVTHKINPNLHGLDDRATKYRQFVQALNINETLA